MQEKHTNEIVSQNSFSHVFNIPFDVFYSTFIEKNFLPYVVFNKSELISMLRDTDMADEGNEITLRIINQYTFTLKVENKISRPNFKSFTHRCINSPTMFASFIVKGWSVVVQLLLVPLTLSCLGVYENGVWKQFQTKLMER